MGRNVFFIGFMGTGKTTVGKAVSKKLGLDFVDTDALIEERLGMSIPNIFEKYGECHFRNLENKLITELVGSLDIIVSTGGGTPLYNENMEIMKSNGLVITLETSADVLWTRLKDCENRPVLQKYDTFEKFDKLYNERNKIYRQGHFIIKTDGKSIEQILDESINYILD